MLHTNWSLYSHWLLKLAHWLEIVLKLFDTVNLLKVNIINIYVLTTLRLIWSSNIHFDTTTRFYFLITWIIWIGHLLLLYLSLHFCLNSHIIFHIHSYRHLSKIVYLLLRKLFHLILLLIFKLRYVILILAIQYLLLWINPLHFWTVYISLLLFTFLNSFHTVRIWTFKWWSFVSLFMFFKHSIYATYTVFRVITHSTTLTNSVEI